MFIRLNVTTVMIIPSSSFRYSFSEVAGKPNVTRALREEKKQKKKNLGFQFSFGTS